ncbi:hypothetical protein GC176_22220 [bacterium]|nr:hypothetical protein [bacterium]
MQRMAGCHWLTRLCIKSALECEERSMFRQKTQFAWLSSTVFCVLISVTLQTRAVDQNAASDSKVARPDKLFPGLEVQLYPRNIEKQPEKAGGYLAPAELGEPTGEAFVTLTLAPMKYDAGFNAVARGYLKIETAGEYIFNANNFYDRNALFIDGELICPYRDGEHKEQTAALTAGLHEIVVAGYVEARGTVTIQWKPPGQEKLAPISEQLLFCSTVPRAVEKPVATPASQPAKSTPPSPAKSAADSKAASVAIPDGYTRLGVKGMVPQKLDKQPVHPCISDAFIYARPKDLGLPGGELEFEVESDGLVFLLASWEYDGNPSGGWTQNAVSYGMLADEWAPLGVCPWDFRYSLFFRDCHQGETFSIRTRKYNAPQPIVAKPIDIHAEQFASLIPAEAENTFSLLQFQKLIADKQFASLDELAERYRRDQTIFPSGSTALGLLYWSLTHVRPENSRNLEQRIEDLKQWVKQRPDSVTAKIALANTHARFGDFARGGRLASDVSDTQMGAYVEGHEQAMEILEPLLKAETPDPELYAALIHSTRALGGEADDVRQWALQALRLYPWYLHAINESATYFLPRWYGAEGDLVRLADALAGAAGDEGDAAYAKVVLSVRDYATVTTLHEDSFDLERLRRGLKQLQEKSPRSRSLRDETCYLACLALDREWASELFAKIGEDPELNVWQKREFYKLWQKIFSDESFQGEQKSLFMPHVLGTWQAIYSGDDKHVVTAGRDDFLQVWNLETNRKVAEVRSFADGISKLCRFDDHTVLTGSSRGVISAWDWQSGAFQPFARLQGTISCLDYRADRQLLLAGTNSGALIVVELKTGKTILSAQSGMHGGKVVARFSDDGDYFITTGGDGRISIYSIKVGREESAIPSDGAVKTAVVMSHDGKYVASGSRNGVVAVWEVETGKLIGKTDKTEEDVTDLEFSPDGKLLGVAFGTGKYSEFGNCSLIKVSADGLAKRDVAGHSMAVFSLEFSADGTEMLTGGSDWTVRRYDVKEIAARN